MIKHFDDELKGRLAQIEAGGRRLLTRRADLAARTRALDFALRSVPVVPALALPAALVGGGGMAAWAATGLGLPMFLFLATWLVLRGRIAIDRTAALALVDDRLALQDRLSTADQFLGELVRDGFRAAAIEEAAPWIERARATLIADDREPAAADWRRRWPFLAAGAALLLVAWLVHRPHETGTTSSPTAALRATVTSAPGPGMTAVRIDPVPSSLDRISVAIFASARAAFGGAAGSSAAPTGGASPGEPGGAAGERVGPAAADAGSGAPAGAAAGAGLAAPGMAGTTGARARGAPPETAAHGAVGASIVNDKAVGADGGGEGAQAPATRTQGSPFGVPGAAPPSTGTRSGRHDGDGNQKQQSGRNQSGEQNSQPGQGNGSGENGQRGGTTNALKSSRGVAGLLLAAPAEDRLIGTPGHGPVTSVSRPGAPRTSAAGVVTAQDRGAAGGGLRAGPRDLASRHDDRLVGAFFDRRGSR